MNFEETYNSVINTGNAINRDLTSLISVLQNMVNNLTNRALQYNNQLNYLKNQFNSNSQKVREDGYDSKRIAHLNAEAKKDSIAFWYGQEYEEWLRNIKQEARDIIERLASNDPGSYYDTLHVLNNNGGRRAMVEAFNADKNRYLHMGMRPDQVNSVVSAGLNMLDSESNITLLDEIDNILSSEDSEQLVASISNCLNRLNEIETLTVPGASYTGISISNEQKQEIMEDERQYTGAPVPPTLTGSDDDPTLADRSVLDLSGMSVEELRALLQEYQARRDLIRGIIDADDDIRNMAGSANIPRR